MNFLLASGPIVVSLSDKPEPARDISIDVVLGMFATAGWFLLAGDRKSTRLNSSHSQSSYAVFCLKKKNRPAHAAHSAPPSRTTPAAFARAPGFGCPHL